MSKGFRVQDIGELLEETIEEVTRKATGADAPEGGVLSMGLLDIDGAIGGLRPGELVCIAGQEGSWGCLSASQCV